MPIYYNDSDNILEFVRAYGNDDGTVRRITRAYALDFDDNVRLVGEFAKKWDIEGQAATLSAGTEVVDFGVPSNFDVGTATTYGATVANRDTSGFLSNNTWDFRDGAAADANSLNPTSWADLTSNYYRVDSTAGVEFNVHNQTVSLLLFVGNSEATFNGVVVIGAGSDTLFLLGTPTDTEGNPPLEGTLSFQATPNDSLPTFTISNPGESIDDITGTFTANEDAAAARTRIKNALNASTQFTNLFSFTKDTEENSNTLARYTADSSGDLEDFTFTIDPGNTNGSNLTPVLNVTTTTSTDDATIVTITNPDASVTLASAANADTAGTTIAGTHVDIDYDSSADQLTTPLDTTFSLTNANTLTITEVT